MDNGKGFLWFGLCLTCGVGAWGVQVQANPPGISVGDFKVSDGGGASYSIAIDVPPGTRGLEPVLSLSYNSQAGNGIVGLGWFLTGISAIERCPRTQVVDDAVGGVNHDGRDRFCLDGERLILTGSGPYASAGSVYRTERDDFKRVQGLGSVVNEHGGSAPERFEVKTKGGTVLQFGSSPGSRVTLPGKASIHKWLLDRVSDRHGNALEITYDHSLSAQHVPSRIDYTVNESAGSSADRAVVFGYEPRPDTVTEYVAGNKFESTQRLKTVHTEVDAAVVREYRLNYETDASTGRSRLTRITECGSQGGCLPAHKFVWQDGGDLTFTHSALNPIIGAASLAAGDGIRLGDWNSDGFTDVMWYSAGNGTNRWYVNKGGGGYRQYLNPVSATGGRFHFGDWNGDGQIDVMVFSASSGKNLWYVNNGGMSFTRTANPIARTELDPNQGATWSAYPGDWNRDGITDVMWYQRATGKTRWYTNDGRLGFSVAVDPITPSQIAAATAQFSIQIGDWNGDGTGDFLFSNESNGTNRWYLNDGDLSFSLTLNPIPASEVGRKKPLRLGDWNGDGLTDVMWYKGDGTNRWYLNRGDGTFTSAFLNPLPKTYFDIFATTYYGDWNGDGRTDMIIWQPTNGENRWLENRGGFQFAETLNPVAPARIDDGTALYVGDWDGNGLEDILWYNQTSGGHRLLTNNRVQPDLIKSITDSLGANVKLGYAPLTDSSVYTKDSSATYPEIDLQMARYVVAKHAQSDGTEDAFGKPGMYRFTYRYGGAKAHLRGRGVLGFRWREATDTQTGIRAKRFFRQDFPHVGAPSRTEMRLGNGTLIGETVYQYGKKTKRHPSGNETYVVYTKQTVERSFELDGSPATTVITDTTVDWVGNPKTVVVDSGDGFVKRTNTTFFNNTNQWLFGLPARVEVTHTALGMRAVTRISEFSYDTSTGALLRTVIEPNSTPDVSLSTTYTYDVFGNRIQTTVSGSDFATRTSRATYDANGRFPISATNALGHTEARVYDPACGAVASLTGPNNLTTTWTFDEFCRPVVETRPDGTKTTTTYQFETTPYTVATQSTGQPAKTVTLDFLGRTTQTVTEGFLASKPIHQDVVYDFKGRITHESEPHFPGDPIHWSEYEYDVIGRVTRVTKPDQSTTTTNYQGLTTVVTNDLFQTTTTTKNAASRIVKVLDNASNPLTYAYDAVGNLIQTTDPQGNVVTMTYDLRGRRLSMVDPDMGTWTYTYNTLGEMTAQTDAKNQTQSMTYDKLGRLKTRTTAEGVSTWTYDTATKGIGKLKKVVAPGYTRTHRYDPLARPSSTTVRIGPQSFTGTTTYDARGRIKTVSYPGGFLTIKNLYNARGYLNKIVDSAGGALLWQLNNITARGQVQKETAGNGLVSTRTYDDPTGRIFKIKTGPAGSVQHLRYSFDPIGNLTERKRVNQSTSETFGYDALNRLVFADMAGAITTVDYDSIGNITYKSDVGTYTYGRSGAGPHALSRIDTSTANPVPGGNGFDPQGGYTYDANGNAISGSGRTITWTTFNKPERMISNDKTVTYHYGPEFQRVQKTVDTNKATYYVGHAYEKTIEKNAVTQKVYVQAGGSTVEVRKVSNQAKAFRYYHKDHLGSPAVITDSGGAVVERLSFDPWGRRRNPDWSHAAGHVPSSTTKGFTGHEVDDEVGLVNMNARIYDPVLGRFLSPDPVVPGAGDIQSYNRYAYARNNPTRLVDPTGNTYFDTSAPGDPCASRYGCRVKTWYDGDNMEWHSQQVRVSRSEHLRGVRNDALDSVREFWGRSDLTAEQIYSIATATTPEATRGVPYAKRRAAVEAVNTAYEIDVYLRKRRKGFVKSLAQDLAPAAMVAIPFLPVNPYIAAGGFTAAAGGDIEDVVLSMVAVGVTRGINNVVESSAFAFHTGGDFSAFNTFAKVGVKAVGSGVAAQLNGGNFTRGFVRSGLGQGLSAIYTQLVGYNPTWARGGDAVLKEGQSALPRFMMNNIGSTTIFPTELGTGLFEGSPLSVTLNVIPGLNSTAGLHDWMTHQFTHSGGLDGAAFQILNWGTMPIAAAWNYAALLGTTWEGSLVLDRLAK